MLKDKHFCNLEKMKYKYSGDFAEFMQTLSELYYKELPIWDFNGNNIVFIENHAAVSQNAVKLLLKNQNNYYGVKTAEDEIVATSAIENRVYTRIFFPFCRINHIFIIRKIFLQCFKDITTVIA